MRPWIAVDLDGTLAQYHGFEGPLIIGDPVPAMVNRVKQWLDAGYCVKIFTARVDGGIAAEKLGKQWAGGFRDVAAVRAAIEDWCELHLGVRLEVTNVKDYAMVELWDDRAVRVEHNTGNPCCPQLTRIERLLQRGDKLETMPSTIIREE